MAEQIPFDKAFVVAETKRHMLKAISFSENKTVARLDDLSVEKSQEALQTLLYLTSIKNLVESIPNDFDINVLKAAIGRFQSHFPTSAQAKEQS